MVAPLLERTHIQETEVDYHHYPKTDLIPVKIGHIQAKIDLITAKTDQGYQTEDVHIRHGHTQPEKGHCPGRGKGHYPGIEQHEQGHRVMRGQEVVV